MRQETFPLSQKELQRVSVISACIKGDMAFASAPEPSGKAARFPGNARRKLGGANRGRRRAALSRDIAASRTRIGQHNPTQPTRAGRTGGGASDAARCELVAKREDLRLQGSTGPKTGGY